MHKTAKLVLILTVLGLLSALVTAPAVAANSVRLTADTLRPVVGQPVVLTARVEPKAPGRSVVFERRDGADWVRIGTDTTAASGVARITTRFRSAGATVVRAVARAHRGNPAETATLRLTVVRAPSTVSGAFAPGPWKLGARVQVPVQVDPAQQGRKAWLERRDGTSWTRVSEVVQTGADGGATTSWTPTRVGASDYRVAVAPSATHAASASPAVSRTVQATEGEYLGIVVPPRVTTGSMFEIGFTVGHETENLTDAGLTVRAPMQGSQVTPPDDVVVDPATREGTVTVGDQAAGPLLRVPLRWTAPAAAGLLDVRAELTADGVTETVTATIDVVASPGGIVFGGGLAAMTESRDAPMHPDAVFGSCIGGTYGQQPPPVPTFAGALTQARAYLSDTMSAQHANAWNNLAAQNDVDLLDELVGIAVADQRPAAALAASLRAYELEPGDGLHLSNAAAAANMLDRPEWAVAFALEAGKASASASVGVRQDAVRLVNLGHAWALRRELVKAEAALRQALAIDPSSNSVHGELGRVLACQGNRHGALPHIRRSLRTDDAPDPIVGDEDLGTSRRSTIDSSLLFDLSGGVDQELTLPYFPATWGELAGMSRTIHGGNNYYERENEALKDRVFALFDEERDLEAQLRARQAGASPVQVQRTNDILLRISTNHDRELIDARKAFVEVTRQTFGLNNCDGMFRSHPFCSVDGSDDSCSSSAAVFNEYERRMEAHLTALAEYHEVVSKHFSGLQAQLSDPIAHALAGVQAEQHFAQEVWYVTSNLRHAADHFHNYNEYWDGRTAEDGPCVAPNVPQTPDPVKTERSPAKFCVKDSPESKVNLNLDFEVVTFSANCEKWSLEATRSVAWLEAFAKYEAPYGSNGATMYLGVKAGGGGASFESALYIEQNAKGKVTDFGWQVGPELSAGGTVSISAYDDKVRISIMSVFVGP